MSGEWRFLCEDCKIEVNLPSEEQFSLQRISELSEDELRECSRSVERLKNLRKRVETEIPVLNRLGVLLSFFLEHHDHDTRLYRSDQNVETESLPWFEKWSWREDPNALKPTAVVKEGWERGLSLAEVMQNGSED
ncbi:hypothetical protein AKJ40_00730 [candidate division MSBL1 archaeon SCGC-AAA259M10]|uniref:Uncharacterized protein n=1 Tax=candidate division MSBL1 archaeon SCGC-AAA259M10 TaxID=1698270 RepID=A0A133V2P1_9EURY|nr:hypothetical protein AKJ40_00730 [candidate division MSBL1 archaeon SCGC-AAA259M10]